MPRKKVEVVELNKKEEEIVLEEKQSALILFIRRHNLLLFLTCLILTLTILGVSVMLVVKNLNSSNNPKISGASVDLSLSGYEAIYGSEVLTDETAKEKFLNNKRFKSSGEVLLVKKLEYSKYTVKFYSDGTALLLLKDTKRATRVNPLANGEYGIDEEGVISSKADTSNVSIVKTKEYPWGTVNYFTDGSAEVINSKMDLFVRNAEDINDKYISNNKVAYLKNTSTAGSAKLNYYYDGTIEVIKNGTSYLVRYESDLNTSDGSFKNGNAATIYKSDTMADGKVIDYYTDGGAIIRDGSQTLSVRKSNSIVIKDNKIFEIIDSIYVTESKKDGNVTYYTNGGAVINNYNGETIYVPENADIKNNGSQVIGDYEKLSNETNNNGENIKTFDHTAVVTTNDYIAIVPKEKVIYDKNGNIKEILDVSVGNDLDGFTITNNENEKITYRVALERSDRTTMDVRYIRYMIAAGSKNGGPDNLIDHTWKDDYVSKQLKVTGTNYILVEKTLDPLATDTIQLMLWTDYKDIPNSEQDKYFYGTIKVYAWTEDEKK